MIRRIEGTRVTVAQLLCELADGLSLSEIADDMDWPLPAMQEALRNLARDLQHEKDF